MNDDGHDHAGHDHDHAGHSHDLSADADRRYLTIAVVPIVGFMAFETVVGIVAHSLALLSDAAHMLRSQVGGTKRSCGFPWSRKAAPAWSPHAKVETSVSFILLSMVTGISPSHQKGESLQGSRVCRILAETGRFCR